MVKVQRMAGLAAVAIASTLALSGCGGGSSSGGGNGVTAGGTATPTPTPTPTPSPTPTPTSSGTAIQQTSLGTFSSPWAIAFAPGTATIFVTQQGGTMHFVDTKTGRIGTVSGMPSVDFGGQGGLGDVAFLASEAAATVGRRTIYLSWAESGGGDIRGAVVGRGTLICDQAAACRVEALSVLWRQTPKVDGRGHYSHKIAVSPDERHLFISSGDRQKGDPAQDTGNTLGTIVRLNLNGAPATGNPLAARGGPSNEIWSFGHRNVLGLQFAADGSLWAAEHGPLGGDEFNRIESGENYGWPIVSNGNHYDGRTIPDHSTRPEFKAPALSWTPAIAPGDFIFYSGSAFGAWRGSALIAGLKSTAIVQVKIDGSKASEVARYSFDNRLRDIAQGPDGNVYVIEDGDQGRLLKLTPG